MALQFVVTCVFSQTIEKPTIKTVNVQENGNVEIEWLYVNISEISGYKIKRWIYPAEAPSSNGFQTIGTVDDASQTKFVDTDAHANLKKRIYLVCAIDNEDNESLPSDEMQTIWLNNDIHFDSCDFSNTFRFTEFFPEYEPTYTIEFKTENTDWQTIETLNSSQLNIVDSVETYENSNPTKKTKIYQFKHYEIDSFKTFQYRVTAKFNETVESCSNIEMFETPDFHIPQPPVITNVSVSENNQIDILINFDEEAEAIDYSLFRRLQNDSDSILINNSENQFETFTDDNVDVNNYSYSYHVNYKTNCGSIEGRNDCNTILLTLSRADSEVKLEWNPYECWDVDHYKIFRTIQGQSFEEIGIATDTFFADIQENTSEQCIYTYYVQAVGSEENQKSNSNRVLTADEISFFIPNAFKIDGTANVFKPIFQYELFSNYRFQIYSRWGQLIFETDDIQEGWDGKINGNVAESGTFVWIISYETILGSPKKAQGTVVIL